MPQQVLTNGNMATFFIHKLGLGHRKCSHPARTKLRTSMNSSFESLFVFRSIVWGPVDAVFPFLEVAPRFFKVATCLERALGRLKLSLFSFSFTLFRVCSRLIHKHISYLLLDCSFRCSRWNLQRQQRKREGIHCHAKCMHYTAKLTYKKLPWWELASWVRTWRPVFADAVRDFRAARCVIQRCRTIYFPDESK